MSDPDPIPRHPLADRVIVVSGLFCVAWSVVVAVFLRHDAVAVWSCLVDGFVGGWSLSQAYWCGFHRRSMNKILRLQRRLLNLLEVIHSD